MALRKDTTLNDEVLSQVKTNFFSDEKETKEPELKEDKKDYSDNYILRMPKGDRTRVKTFCASKNVSMSSFIMFAIDHLIDEIDEGNYSVSKSGVRKVKREGE